MASQNIAISTNYIQVKSIKRNRITSVDYRVKKKKSFITL